MRILNISNDREKVLMSYAPECWQDITQLASRPHGLRQQMSASTVDIYLLPDRVRVICDRPEQPWGYVVDIIDPGEYRVDHFSFNRVVEVDPEKYEAEEWYPWESSDDFMRKVAAEDPDSGFVFVRPRPVEPEPMPDLAPPPQQEAWRKTLYGPANKPWTDLTPERSERIRRSRK